MGTFYPDSSGKYLCLQFFTGRNRNLTVTWLVWLYFTRVQVSSLQWPQPSPLCHDSRNMGTNTWNLARWTSAGDIWLGHIGTHIGTGRYLSLSFNSNEKSFLRKQTGLTNYDKVLTSFLLGFLKLTSVLSLNRQNSSSWRTEKVVASRSHAAKCMCCILAKLHVPSDVQRCPRTLGKYHFKLEEANFMT